MIDLGLGKEDMLCYMQDVRALREMRRGLSDHYVVPCKVRTVGTRVKRREVLIGGRRFRSEKLREYQYAELYARCLRE